MRAWATSTLEAAAHVHTQLPPALPALTLIRKTVRVSSSSPHGLSSFASPSDRRTQNCAARIHSLLSLTAGLTIHRLVITHSASRNNRHTPHVFSERATFTVPLLDTRAVAHGGRRVQALGAHRRCVTAPVPAVLTARAEGDQVWSGPAWAARAVRACAPYRLHTYARYVRAAVPSWRSSRVREVISREEARCRAQHRSAMRYSGRMWTAGVRYARRSRTAFVHTASHLPSGIPS
jgi:hypothetical protein